jgi:hypothetical protein
MSEPRNCWPEAFGFAFAFGDAEHFPVAQGIKPDRHHHRTRHHLHVSAKAAVTVCGIGIVKGAAVVMLPAQEGLDLFVEALTNAAFYRFGDAACLAQRLSWRRARSLLPIDSVCALHRRP